MIAGPAEELSGIAAVGPHQADAAMELAQALKDRPGRVAVLHARRGHRDDKQQSEGVHHQVPFAAHDFLARVVAA